jgi:hypothetical protein
MKIAPVTIERQASSRPAAAVPDGIRPPRRRRPRAVAALLAALAGGGLGGLALGTTACGPLISEAPFRSRPDSVEAADLRGPYLGQVIDAETDKPVDKALVYGAWAFERGVGLIAPRGAAEITVETDANGRYRIPPLTELPGGLSMRVARFTLIVYKRGYVAYRSDTHFPDLSPRRDFVQRGNTVRLVPWSAELSHARHLGFLGGGASVHQAADWELEPAALELDRAFASKRPERLPVTPLLDATPLLSADEVRVVTGYKGRFQERRLRDLARTSFYDSRHFQAVDRPQTFDVALRVWKLGADAAEERYLKLLGDLPGATSRNEIADRSLRAQEGEIVAIALLHRANGTVLEMTCGTGLCRDHETLARMVLPRLDRIATEAPAPAPSSQPAGATAPPAATAPATPAAPTPPEPGDDFGDFKLQAPGSLRLPKAPGGPQR